jgi:hypothetical protein
MIQIPVCHEIFRVLITHSTFGEMDSLQGAGITSSGKNESESSHFAYTGKNIYRILIRNEEISISCHDFSERILCKHIGIPGAG